MKEGSIASLKVLVVNCGPPPKQLLSTAGAAAEGVSALVCVRMRELGGDWEEGTMRAARCVETLRYVHKHGCHWGDATLSCFAKELPS